MHANRAEKFSTTCSLTYRVITICCCLRLKTIESIESLSDNDKQNSIGLQENIQTKYNSNSKQHKTQQNRTRFLRYSTRKPDGLIL